MAKKKGQVKKTPSLKKAKKLSSQKAHPKKKANAAPTKMAKATPRKNVLAAPAKKVKGVPKTQPKKKATTGKAPKTLPIKKDAPLTNAPRNAEAVLKMPEGGPVVAEKPVTYPNLRRRVGELLNTLNHDRLQRLHFKMTDPGAERKINTDEEADGARAKFPPLDRPALIQQLTTMAVDEFHLADDPDLAERIKDENSLRRFLTSKMLRARSGAASVQND